MHFCLETGITLEQYIEYIIGYLTIEIKQNGIQSGSCFAYHSNKSTLKYQNSYPK